MKIALVHDQLQEFGGAERVLVALKDIFPEADVYTSFYNPESLGIHAKHFKGWNIITSWGDKIPLFRKLYSPLRFLTPYLWEAFNFNGYDLVISSSGAYMCKGVVTRPETTHICYIHHQPRYLYYYETAREWQKYWPIRVYGHLINHGLRIWDYLSSQRVDYFISNAEETKKRVKKFYRRESDVIYPPVQISEQTPEYKVPDKDGYYITTARLTRAKHIDILIQAANEGDFKLKIIGTGRDEEYLKSISGPNIEFLSNVHDDTFRALYTHAKAFLFASVDEEFGIAPIEAMGYGIPVIAYASGGLKETVIDGENGFLYHELETKSVLKKIRTYEKLSEGKLIEMKKQARKTAEQYSFAEFKKQILAFVKKNRSNRHARTS